MVQHPVLTGETQRDDDQQELRQGGRINHEQRFTDPGICSCPNNDIRPAITESRIHAEKRLIDDRKGDRQKHVVENGGNKRKQDEQPARNQSGGDAKITSAFAIELTQDENAHPRQRAQKISGIVDADAFDGDQCRVDDE